MKPARTSHDWLVALTFTAGLHLLLVMIAALPSTYYFPPLAEMVIAAWDLAEDSSRSGQTTGADATAIVQDVDTNEAESADTEAMAIPYRHATRQRTQAFVLSSAARVIPELLKSIFSGEGAFRSLARQGPMKRLAPPRFSSSTIPLRPDKSMEQVVDDDAEAILLGNVFDAAIPATATSRDFLQAEAEFRKTLHRDIADGRLDMPFATFIITAEYFHLSRSLLVLGQQPSFSLEDAMARYNDRLRRVSEGLPKEIDSYSLIMILQRYAENKFYPGNGSGMLLDSLFHFQNDCEGGTKEILAYLQALYPALHLGSNRGMLQTTTGDLIGHMQAFIGPGPGIDKIIENDRGLIVETTRVSFDSVLPYQSGDVFPLEDFVIRYYPDVAADSPLAAALAARDGQSGEGGKRIVGTSDNPLKMAYGATATLLADQLYDLDALRTQRIANEFLKNDIPSCNPRIDPTKIDRTNLFANFVAIDRKLRKNLIGHYLADLQYWDNQLMPEWRMPDFLAGYEDLAGSLLDENAGDAGYIPQGHTFRLSRQAAQLSYIQVDAENTLPLGALQSHGRLLKRLQADAEKARDRHQGTGKQECASRAVLDDRLLSFLFKGPEGPGLYFLPSPGEKFSWPDFQEDILTDCLAMPAAGAERTLLATLEEDATRQGSSLRREVYRQARSRGLTPDGGEDRLPAIAAVLAGIVTGVGDEAAAKVLAGRQSQESTAAEPSAGETIAELGSTGFSGGLVWDIADFLGSERLRGLFLLYGKRGDLRLTVPRAHELIAQLAAILDGGLAMDYLAELQSAVGDRTLRLAVDLNLAKLRDRPSSEISRIALDYLKDSGSLRAETLLSLVQYGLAEEEARSFLRGRLAELLPRIAGPAAGSGAAPPNEEVFVELAEIVKTLQQLSDRETWMALDLGLRDSLFADFAGNTVAGTGERAVVDYGLLFNKLTVLAFLRERVGREKQGDEGLSLSWIKQFVRFASDQPIGKLMLGPVEKIIGRESLATVMTGIISEQMALIDGLATESGQQAAAGRRSGDAAGALREARTVLGDANVIARMLVSAPAPQVAEISGLPAEQFAGNDKSKAGWYLERLHRRIAPIVSGAAGVAGLTGKSQDLRPDPAAWTGPVAAYYLDDRVRESFALLAYFQGSGDGSGVKFTRNQDLAAIKDPAKLRIVERERKVTRQDMSLLTLALNSGNDPSVIRRTWEETLAATGKHLGLTFLDQGLRHYLFAPHHPYLTENDQGFFYSPETVADLHNAAEWGGRNDILLSSYLHFRNLPGQLPDWLRRTAMARSELELKIIKKLEQQTFLPMILECDADKKDLPDPLFRAKWAIRKPFGEDIFPGTLLLLRLGYLEITATGDIVRTAKYADG